METEETIAVVWKGLVEQLNKIASYDNANNDKDKLQNDLMKLNASLKEPGFVLDENVLENFLIANHRLPCAKEYYKKIAQKQREETDRLKKELLKKDEEFMTSENRHAYIQSETEDNLQLKTLELDEVKKKLSTIEEEQAKVSQALWVKKSQTQSQEVSKANHVCELTVLSERLLKLNQRVKELEKMLTKTRVDLMVKSKEYKSLQNQLKDERKNFSKKESKFKEEFKNLKHNSDYYLDQLLVKDDEMTKLSTRAANAEQELKASTSDYSNSITLLTIQLRSKEEEIVELMHKDKGKLNDLQFELEARDQQLYSNDIDHKDQLKAMNDTKEKQIRDLEDLLSMNKEEYENELSKQAQELKTKAMTIKEQKNSLNEGRIIDETFRANVETILFLEKLLHDNDLKHHADLINKEKDNAGKDKVIEQLQSVRQEQESELSKLKAQLKTYQDHLDEAKRDQEHQNRIKMDAEHHQTLKDIDTQHKQELVNKDTEHRHKLKVKEAEFQQSLNTNAITLQNQLKTKDTELQQSLKALETRHQCELNAKDTETQQAIRDKDTELQQVIRDKDTELQQALRDKENELQQTLKDKDKELQQTLKDKDTELQQALRDKENELQQTLNDKDKELQQTLKDKDKELHQDLKAQETTHQRQLYAKDIKTQQALRAKDTEFQQELKAQETRHQCELKNKNIETQQVLSAKEAELQQELRAKDSERINYQFTVQDLQLAFLKVQLESEEQEHQNDLKRKDEVCQNMLKENNKLHNQLKAKELTLTAMEIKLKAKHVEMEVKLKAKNDEMEDKLKVKNGEMAAKENRLLCQLQKAIDVTKRASDVALRAKNAELLVKDEEIEEMRDQLRAMEAELKSLRIEIRK